MASSSPALFLLVDAIPCDLAREVWAEGGMPGFGEPRPMVSVFPSLTHVAVPALLRGIFDARPPGYEGRYYHPPSGEIRGGVADPVSDAPLSPYRARPRGALSVAAVYALRRPLAYGQMRWIHHRFRQEGGPWLGYLSATDGVAHFSGRAGLARAFRDVCAVVAAAREEHRRREGREPGVVLCSDHGMAFGHLDHLPLKALRARLEAAGFRAGRPEGDGVVLVGHGDVGAGAVYADAARAAEVAEVVVGAPGVDLAFAREGEGCLVLAPPAAAGETPARARVRWRGDAYCYEPEAGDPLSYTALFQSLAAAGRLRDGWVADRELFAASWDQPYPDAPARLRGGLGELVEFPAQVLFSMRDSHTVGPALTHAGAVLVGGQSGTHGSLSAAQSLGFAACTDDAGDPWAGAPALRPEDVFRPWRALVRAGGEGAR